MKKLDKAFYMRDTLIISEELLGKYLVHETPSGRLVCRIVETEAYMGIEDKGAHSYGGKRTPKNESMYHEGGIAYVYLIYGMYSCFNIVTEEAGKPTAVLVRAVEPVEGLGLLSQNRYKKPYDSLTRRQVTELTNGPGKLCMAMNISREKDDRRDLCGDILYVCEDSEEPFSVKTSPRINIDYAEEYVHKPWRFFIEGNRYVSR